MDSRQLGILQHTLGADVYGRRVRGYERNHFVAGGADEQVCRGLVELGLMVEQRMHPELTGGLPCFSATDAGRGAVSTESPAPPKQSRSAKRYQRFMDQDCGMRFGEWLKSSEARQ